MFISIIGCIASVVGAVLAVITHLKAVQDRVILAHDHLKILNDDMNRLVEFICNSITICETGIGKDNYKSFMLKTRLLDSYLSYFIYKKEYSILDDLKLPNKYKHQIKEKEKVIKEIRKKIYQSRNKYRNRKSKKIISVQDFNYLKSVYSDIRNIINKYQKGKADKKSNKK